MIDIAERPPRAPGIDSAWLDTVVSIVQISAFDLQQADLDDGCETVRKTACAVPPPPSPFERVFLRSLLFDFAANGGQRLHERAHREDRRRSCAFSPPALLDECWKTRDVDPRQLLSAWAGRFFSALSATHPPTLADRAARLLRTEYYVAWTASALSARLGASRSALRNSFAREFRVTMHDYLRVTRLVRALEQFATVGKVDTIALKVGYRGRATFYQALNEFTRLTPTAFRQLTPPESYAIVESLRSRLARRT